MKFSSVLALCVMIDAWLVLCRVEAHWFWGRRRRRRVPPPPVIDCTYTSWSGWSTCDRYCDVNGDQTRTRRVDRPASGGGSCNGPTSQTQSCTIANNCRGPSAQCDIYNGQCSCSSAGYYLDGNTCKDRNECSVNSGKGPCDQKCTNTAGSYKCSCNNGYLLSPPHSCRPKDCGSLWMPSCPSNSYVDSFSPACNKVAVSCPSGTKFQQSCSLSCTNGYKVGKITPQSGQQFGQDYNKVDFKTAKTTTTCSLDQGGNGVAWDVSSGVNSYYCRRINDPPTDITLTNATLPEHSSIGHVVGKLTSKDMQQSQSYTYSVQKNSVLFTCQGNILKSTWRDPDLHGSIPLQNGTIDITIRSKDNGNPAMWRDKVFTISITNVNDPPTNITLSNNNVLENATVGDVIGIFKARDKDDPPGKPASSNFLWSLTKDSNGVFALKGALLVVDKKLDHESQKIHVISVSCTDRGSPPKTTTQDFVINVQNVNELPVSLALSSSSVNENSKPGTIVGVLTASDDDNDRISFSISQSSNLTLSKFKLSNSNCSSILRSVTCQSLLMVQGELDYEVKTSYHLIVVASDKSGQIVKEWTINVVNKNERPSGIKLTGSHEIPENSPKGTSVGSFVVTDSDNKNSIIQRHSCELISGDVEYFTIEANTVVLKVSGGRKLDFETKNKLNITVKCTDDGSNPPNLFVLQWFVLSVTDVNEPPSSVSLSKLTIPENSPKGTLVGKLSCDDPEKAYQNYTYTVEGPKDTPFKLRGSFNEDVIVDGQVDYEKTKQLQLTIRVTDSDGLYLEKMFTIAVEDVNEPPKGIILQGQNKKLTIQEETIGFYISVVNLDDEDAGDKDPSYCHLIDNAENRVNLIKSSNWILKSGPKKTDYETSSGHLTITLNCSDSHNKSIVQSFNITISDINEKPTDIKLANNTVQENQDKVYIGMVTVMDPDIHQSHQCVVCEINQGGCSLSQFFEVNTAMELKTKKALNFEAKNVYDIKITCTDKPPPQVASLSVERPFTVRVIDVNEPPSSLCSSPIFLSKFESNGAIITPLNAVDPDNEQNNKQKLSYSMDNDLYGRVFQLKENHIFKNKEISSLQNFTLTITVTDNGRVVSIKGGFIFTSLLSTVFNCTVIITDTEPSTTIRLSSNIVSILAPKDSIVGVLSTIGTTQGEVYSYKLLDSQFKPFVVVGNKLKVLLTDIPHVGISSPSSKELIEDVIIQSTDSKGRVITKKMIIIIKDDAPDIPMCLVKHSINENQAINSVVGQILIEDPTPAKYQCSKTKCCSQIGLVPANSFKYHCQVNNPDNNAIIVPQYNVTALFHVDDQYVLRSRVRFNYQDYADRKGQLKVAISCHDLARPLHMLWMMVIVKIIDCDANYDCPYPSECARCENSGACQDDVGSYTCLCPAGFTGEHCEINIDYCKPNLCQYGSSCVDMKTSFKCVCRPPYTGLLCNKNPELCKDCKSNTLCVKFVEAAKRCLPDEYQVPILVNEQNLNPQKLLNIEDEIAKLAEEKLTDKQKPVSNRKRRSSKARFHVETLKNESISDKTLLLLAIMDDNNGYEPLTATAACALLKDTDRHCIDKTDCGTIKESGKKCPVIGAPKASAAARNEGGLGDGASAGIGLVGVFVIIVVLVAAVFYYRRKAQKSKACDDHNVVYNPNQESVDFQNPVYAEGNVNNAVALQDLMNDRLGKEDLVHANLDPNSVKKRNDIKVTDNALYTPPHGREFSTENPSYVPAGAAARIPKKSNIEDEKKVNVDPKAGKSFSYPLDTDTYEDLDDIKNTKGHYLDKDPKIDKELSVPLNDDSYEHLDDLKGNNTKGSKVGKGLAMNGNAMKDHACEKPKITVPREERRPRYEQNPVERFPKRKDHDYENTKEYNSAIGNPLYDDVGHSSDPRKGIYENVVKTPDNVEKDFEIADPVKYEDVGDNSIINPLYDLADSTMNLGQEPLYEDIPAVKLTSSSEKPKKKGFRRSMSSEKSSGYEELRENQDGGKKVDDDDVFTDSNA